MDDSGPQNAFTKLRSVFVNSRVLETDVFLSVRKCHTWQLVFWTFLCFEQGLLKRELQTNNLTLIICLFGTKFPQKFCLKSSAKPSSPYTEHFFFNVCQKKKNKKKKKKQNKQKNPQKTPKNKKKKTKKNTKKKKPQKTKKKHLYSVHLPFMEAQKL